MKSDAACGFLEREMMNRYPDYGTVRAKNSDARWAGRSPFRTTGLPAWQLSIIARYPSLYLSNEDLGVPNYCHLALGFQVNEQWARVISGMSRTGATILDYLHSSDLQRDARIAVVRVEEKGERLKVGISDNLRAPFRGIWRTYLDQIQMK